MVLFQSFVDALAAASIGKQDFMNEDSLMNVHTSWARGHRKAVTSADGKHRHIDEVQHMDLSCPLLANVATTSETSDEQARRRVSVFQYWSWCIIYLISNPICNTAAKSWPTLQFVFCTKAQPMSFKAHLTSTSLKAWAVSMAKRTCTNLKNGECECVNRVCGQETIKDFFRSFATWKVLECRIENDGSPHKTPHAPRS